MASNADHLTGKRVARLADFLEDMLRSLYPKRVVRDFPLGVFIHELRQLRAGPEVIFDDPAFCGLSKSMRAALLAGVVRAERAAKAFQVVGDQDLFKTKLNAVKQINFADPKPKRAPTNAWDTLFEVEVAAQGRFGPLAARLAPTDVLFTDAFGVSLGFECKRPKTRDSVGNAVGKAVNQLHKEGVGGVVLVSGDLIVEPLVVLRGQSSAEVECKKEIEAAFRGAIEACRTRLPYVDCEADPDLYVKSVFGVLFSATLLTVREEAEGCILNSAFHARPVSNASTPNALELLRIVRDGLKLGQMELRETSLSDRWPHGNAS